MQFGEFELTPLSDGVFRLDGGALFGMVPRALWSRERRPDKQHRITLALRPLLVRGRGHAILIDAGVGSMLDEKARRMYGVDGGGVALLESLRAARTAPEEIDLVIASHLHFDHAGGFVERRGDGQLLPAFPRARYVVRLGEFQDATTPNERTRRSYLAEDIIPLSEAGVLQLVDADGEVAPGVSVVETGGHTAHHQMVVISSRGRRAVFVGDLMPTASHLRLPWIVGYDTHPMDTLARKQELFARFAREEWLVFLAHDPDLTAGYIRDDGGKRRIERVL